MNIELDLITACIKKERRAEFELYKLSYSYLMSICYRYTGNSDEAKEMLNIGFTKILFNLEKYKPEIPFKKWVRRVMINTLIDEYRKELKNQSNIEYIENYNDKKIGQEMNEILVQMNVDQIHSLILKLPPMSQKVFNLYVIDGYNHKEISDLLNMSEGTSKWHLSFSRGKLKEMLEEVASTLNIKL